MPDMPLRASGRPAVPNSVSGADAYSDIRMERRLWHMSPMPVVQRAAPAREAITVEQQSARGPLTIHTLVGMIHRDRRVAKAADRRLAEYLARRSADVDPAIGARVYTGGGKLRDVISLHTLLAITVSEQIR